jgi:hypothetical protein
MNTVANRRPDPPLSIVTVDLTSGPEPPQSQAAPALLAAPAAAPSDAAPATAAPAEVKRAYPGPADVLTQEGPKGLRYDFNDGCRVVMPESDYPWRVRMSDLDTGNILFEIELKS